MRKIFKRKSSLMSPEVESDVAVQVNKMQEQLVLLEKKIDILISQSSERPFERKHFSKPYQRFDRPMRHGGGRQDNNYRERSFTQAICADCQKECEVPFKPSGDRPVYCSDCFSKRKNTGSFKEKFDNRSRGEDFAQGNRFDKQQGGESRGFDKRRRPNFRRRKERA